MAEVSRYVCSVLDEMRTAIKVGRIDMLAGLIEEAQTLVNRMEAKLEDYQSMGYDLDRGREYRKKLRVLRREADQLEIRVEIIEEENLA